MRRRIVSELGEEEMVEVGGCARGSGGDRQGGAAREVEGNRGGREVGEECEVSGGEVPFEVVDDGGGGRGVDERGGEMEVCACC